MTVKRCLHPPDQVSPAEGDYVHCAKCGRTYIPRAAPTPHASYRGYTRHQKKRTGEWMWPIPPDDPCGCRQAQVEWRHEYHNREEMKASRRKRGAARFRALNRLRRLYPGAYAVYYAEELEKIGGRAVRHIHEVPVWDDIVARLVKEALGIDEATLAGRVKARIADRREREVLRQATRLRLLLEQVSKK